jgi:hypothetical protein
MAAKGIRMAARKRQSGTARVEGAATKNAHRRRVPRRRIVHDHSPERLAWYGGLALMAVLEVIDWPLAIVIAIGHEIAHRARRQALRELAEGIEAGA